MVLVNILNIETEIQSLNTETENNNLWYICLNLASLGCINNLLWCYSMWDITSGGADDNDQRFHRSLFFSLVTITIIQYFADDDQLSLSQWSPSPGSSIMIRGDVQYYKSVGCATPVATTWKRWSPLLPSIVININIPTITWNRNHIDLLGIEAKL